MKLYGYSERGLVNALCYDCVHHPEGETLLAQILEEACFPLCIEKPNFATISQATFLVEQSLSDFGDCDLIILCDTNDGKRFAVYCEFKRGRRWSIDEEWKHFTVRVENKIREKLTSNLFCQLYFKERFASQLTNSISQYLAHGLEFDEPLNIVGGSGRRKIGGNETVLRAVDLIRTYASDPLFLMVTPEMMDTNEVGAFIQQTNEWQGEVRGWSTRRWGHLGLPAIHEVCKKIPQAFSHTLEVFEFNHGQLY